MGARDIKGILALASTVVLPLALAYVLAAMDLRSDLSELKPIRATAQDGAALVGWADLPDFEWRFADRHRMIGYMMFDTERPRDGAWVKTFVLMPVAGHFLHPVARDPEKMVEVRLRRPEMFRFRQLAWVTGLLTPAPAGKSSTGTASYTMWDAGLIPAHDSEITHWFTP